ncbi:MAG: phosphate acyltransferase PlsX [Erysipelotrichaceae bacterium]|nr:phosphate acyltransferase PlsX [Erysipelotrichaceae bacterium]
MIMIKIGVDANGGDKGVEATVPGAMRAISMFKDIEIVLFGDENKIKPLLTKSERISIVHTTETMDMGEKDPIRAVRNNKNSSLCMAMYAAKNGEVDAVVTSGPTQCVVMAAHLIIRRLKEMERVALCPILPNFDGQPRLLLDVGANVELKPEHLGQFAVFATVAAKEVLGIKDPTVGMLNIGSEPGKGREFDKESYYYLKDLPNIKFCGNVEPDELCNCPTNIVVSDGYSGNIAMKSLEGTAKNMARMLKQEIKASLGGKIGYLFMKKNLKRFAKRMDTKEVGGAMIFGIGKPVVKAHGNSDGYAFGSAIKQVVQMVKADLINKVVMAFPKEEENKNE